MRSLLLPFGVLFILPGAVYADTYVVQPDGMGDFPTIQAAIDAVVEGDIIELSHGTFLGDGNRDIEFQGKAVTIRSQTTDPATCIIDCEGSEVQRHRGFYFHQNEGPGSIVSGITIVGGYAGVPGNAGGAVLCWGTGSPSFISCVFTDNYALSGGGVKCHAASPSLINCTFHDNSAVTGAGMSCDSATPSLLRCRFENNSGSSGAGVHCNNSPAVLTECLFFLNTAISGSGGGMACYFSSPTLTNCTFSENSAESGGGIRCSGDSHPVLENSIIAFGSTGSAISCAEGSSATLTCCDIYGNAGGDWTGAIAGQLGVAGNICEDPLFCGIASPQDPLALWSLSPCTPGNNPECGLIGARPVGCTSNQVNPDGSGDFPNIQAAIDALGDGHVIHLANGTFTGEGNRDVDFRGKAVHVRSASLDPHSCVIDCEQSGRGFILQSGEGPGSVIEAITIRGGVAHYGGGIYCSGASPSLMGCIFTDDSAHVAGGALYCSLASPVMTSCTLARNSCSAGAGIACRGASCPVLANTIIAFNALGEALACDVTSAPALDCCDLFANAGGDWVACIAEQLGTAGNISANPLFCTPDSFGIHHNSPCRAFTAPNEECDLIGACPVSCFGDTFVVYPDGGGTFPTIQAAIDSSYDGVTIMLGDGIFTGAGNRGIDFQGKSITVRSENGDPERCIIDCEGATRGFYFHLDEGPESVLEGVTVRNGYRQRGGGVHIGSSSPRLVNCIFSGNTAQKGGGVFLYNDGAGAPSIEDCAFLDNYAQEVGGCCGVGGGFYGCSYGSNLTVTFTTCAFSNNLADYEGGAAYMDGTFYAHFIGCTFTGNWAGDGAGCFVDWTTVTLANCTFCGNSSTAGWCGAGAVIFASECWVYLDNSIIAFNDAMAGCDDGTGHHPAGILATCSDVFGNTDGDWIGSLYGQLGQDGNISLDPLFCDPANGDYRLQESSPCAPVSPPNPECDLIGAWPVGCATSAVRAPDNEPWCLSLTPGTPSPFALTTQIGYQVPGKTGPVQVGLNIYDATGRLIRTLLDAPRAPGVYSLSWDGADQAGTAVPAGIYFCRLSVGGNAVTRQLVRLR